MFVAVLHGLLALWEVYRLLVTDTPSTLAQPGLPSFQGSYTIESLENRNCTVHGQPFQLLSLSPVAGQFPDTYPSLRKEGD